MAEGFLTCNSSCKGPNFCQWLWAACIIQDCTSGCTFVVRLAALETFQLPLSHGATETCGGQGAGEDPFLGSFFAEARICSCSESSGAASSRDRRAYKARFCMLGHKFAPFHASLCKRANLAQSALRLPRSKRRRTEASSLRAANSK